MDYKEKITELFSKGEGRLVDLFYELFCYILTLDFKQQVDSLQFVCENAKKIKNSDDNTIIIKEYYKEGMIEKYWENAIRLKDQSQQLAFDCSKNNIKLVDFYEKLWNLILTNKYCRSKREKAFGLCLIIDSNFIPYRAVGIGISMDDEQFNNIINEIKEFAIADMDMILQINYEQKTQQASLLAEKLQQLETLEQRSIFLSLLIEKIESKLKEKIQDYIHLL